MEDNIPLMATGPASQGAGVVKDSSSSVPDKSANTFSPATMRRVRELQGLNPAFVTLEVDAPEKPSASQLAAYFRKVSVALLPIFFALNCLNFLDRTNLAFAAIQMSGDLGLSQKEYGKGSSIFFFGYCCFQIPSQMVLRRVGAPKWLAVIVTVWGFVAVSMAGINGVTYFYVARLLLGAAEAGSFPGAWYYMTKFYPDSRITFPYAVMDAAIMVAQVLGAPIAAALLSLNGFGGLAGWRWLFLLEGIPTTVLGICLFFLLPASPSKARFLTPTEADAVQREVDGCRGRSTTTHSDFELIADALRNRKLWHISAVKFMKDVTSYGTMFWTPVLIKAMLHHQKTGGDACDSWSAEVKEDHDEGPEQGHFNTSAVLLAGIPFGLAALACVAIARHSQRTRERVKHVGIPYIISGVTFILLPLLLKVHVVLGFIGLTAVIVSALGANGALVSLASAVSEGPGLSINLAMYNSIANAGGLVGPYIVGLIGGNTCSYDGAFFALGAMLLVGGVLVLFLKDPAVEGRAAGVEGTPVCESRPNCLDARALPGIAEWRDAARADSGNGDEDVSVSCGMLRCQSVVAAPPPVRKKMTSGGTYEAVGDGAGGGQEVCGLPAYDDGEGGGADDRPGS